MAAALAGDTRGKRRKYEKHLPALRIMKEFAEVLRARRRERGALDLDLPEVVVELDRDDPRLVRDVRRSRKDPGERGAYSMIEELMLAANEAVAASFGARDELTIWRVHDAPDEEKLEDFAGIAQRYGISVDVEEARTPRGLAKVLTRLRGLPAEKALSFQLLRSLKQATYDTVNIGHFGLASAAYLHFTSPIRRYPDLAVHRLLKRRLAALRRPSGGTRLDTPAPTTAALQQAASDASFAERKAMEVERGVLDLYRAFFMRDRVGDLLEGSISGITSFGAFVTTDEPFIEGLVRVDYLPDDHYIFDEEGLRLVGKRSGRVFALGDRLVVEVLSVSVARRRIDFRVKSIVATERPTREHRARGRGVKEERRTARKQKARAHEAEGPRKPKTKRPTKRVMKVAGAKKKTGAKKRR